MKRSIAYVLQDDLMFPNLTVLETLRFTSELRLPGPSSSRIQAVENLISELNLKHVENTIIGQPFQRGISGGERKRTNIANELLTSPRLVLLDEPTSGLDSSSALKLMNTLRRMARKNQSTIVTSIHQPSSHVYQTFSRVMLVAGGHVLYFGDGSAAVAHFASVGLPCPVSFNPAGEFMPSGSCQVVHY
jgi:ABC-type multidrug transport system ATPase subunit